MRAQHTPAEFSVRRVAPINSHEAWEASSRLSAGRFATVAFDDQGRSTFLRALNHHYYPPITDVEVLAAIIKAAGSHVRLGKIDAVVSGLSDVDQRVPVIAAGANEKAPDIVDLGRHSAEHDLKAAASAGPHVGNRTAAKATWSAS